MGDLFCYFCLIEAEADLGVNTPAVTIYNGIAVCRNHVGEYQRPEWFTDRIEQAQHARVQARRRSSTAPVRHECACCTRYGVEGRRMCPCNQDQ